MTEDDRSYYTRRATIETERARQATASCVAQVHHELARAYLVRLADTDSKPALPTTRANGSENPT